MIREHEGNGGGARAMRGTYSELAAEPQGTVRAERPAAPERVSATCEEALRSVADWQWRIDRDGLLTDIGQGIARTIGVPARLLIGQPFRGLVAEPSNELALAFERQIKEQRPFRGLALVLAAQGGAKTTVCLSGLPQYDVHGRFTGFVGTGTEEARVPAAVDDEESSAAILAAEVEKLVMENVRLRLSLSSQRSGTQEDESDDKGAAQPARRDARVAHELRTPLNAIIGYAEFASGRVTGGEDKVRECLERILTAARHMDAFIGGGFGSSDQPGLELAPVSLNGVLRDVAAMVEPQARAKAVDLSLLTIEGSFAVLAERGALTQVLVNLAVNAIKYNRLGGAVGAEAHAEGTDRVALTIWDTGRGISQQDLPHIFDPGFRGKGLVETDSEAGTTSGRGLGLAISADLARAMGATLDASSELGQGTRITLRLRRSSGRAE